MASSEGFLTNGQLNKHELATENSPPLFADLDIKSPNRREWCCKHIQIDTSCFESYIHIWIPISTDGGGCKGTLKKVLDTRIDSCIDKKGFLIIIMDRLVSKAMDRNHKEKEKEKASMLLYGLYSVVVSSDQIKVGFIKLLEWLRVSSYLSAPHHAELVENKWGGSIRCSSCQMAKGFSRVDQDAFKGGSDRIGGDLPRYKKDTKLITLAMDRKNKEKEMASVLLSALHMEMFSTEDFINGFIMLLESAEDTASDELSLFQARAVIGDDVLAPVNLEKISSSLPPKSTGSETIRSARYMPISTRSSKDELLFFSDPARLERSICKENHTSSIDTTSTTSIDTTSTTSIDICDRATIDSSTRTSIDTNPRADMVATLVLQRDENGDLHDPGGHLCNAAGQKIDGQGTAIIEQSAATEDAKVPLQRSLADLTRPSQFYTNRMKGRSIWERRHYSNSLKSLVFLTFGCSKTLSDRPPRATARSRSGPERHYHSDTSSWERRLRSDTARSLAKKRLGSDVFGATQPGRSRGNDPGATSSERHPQVAPEPVQ
ncbi:hypothetical protein DY000_02006333, partial [Brassica cretica]